MMKLVTFMHGEQPCALDTRVVRGASNSCEGSRIELWRSASECASERYLRVQMPDWDGSIPCSRVRMSNAAGTLWPLPELVMRAIGRGHVRGIVDLEGQSYWFIDLAHYDGARATSTQAGGLSIG